MSKKVRRQVRTYKHYWLHSDDGGFIDHCICKKCGERADFPYDPCDSGKVWKWLRSIYDRHDCTVPRKFRSVGKPGSGVKKPKTHL